MTLSFAGDVRKERKRRLDELEEEIQGLKMFTERSTLLDELEHRMNGILKELRLELNMKRLQYSWIESMNRKRRMQLKCAIK
jgi:hypothetical protein